MSKLASFGVRLRDLLLYRKEKLKWTFWTIRYRHDIEELYRHMAPTYDVVFDGNVTSKRYNAFFEAFMRNLNIKDAVVLDAGTGTGLLAERLAPLARRVIGIDVSSDQLQVLKQQHKGPRNLAAVHASIEAIPLADQSCDVAVTCGTMGMVAFAYFDEELGIAEMARTLKVGGEIGVWFKVCLSRPHPWLRRLAQRIGWQLYDIDSLRQTFERYGLKMTGLGELENQRIRYRGKLYLGVKVAHCTPHLETSPQQPPALAETLR
ncbi:MAG: methyltransferase domain-containing protein [Candidatus Tectomicrobia bacterium]|nr:methyltransferase domain-containing protein [Candidatus Tectomicrobia bacterium]